MGESLLSAERGPFVGGYTSSVPAFMAKPDQLTGDQLGSDTNSSRNCTIDPYTGGVSRRDGIAILDDTVDSITGEMATGLLNYAWPSGGALCRKLFAFDSPSLASGYPTLASLYGKDTNAGFPTADVGFQGTIWLNSHNSGLTTDQNRYSLLEDMKDGDTYSFSPSAKPTAASYRLKIVPIWYESGDGVYNRGVLTGTGGADQFNQQLLTCGSRSLIQTQDKLYAPNLRATPWQWNKRFNESSTVGSEIVRIRPTGPLPPLFPPNAAVGDVGVNDASWVSGDTYFLSVIFLDENGAPSAPFIPRAVNANLPTGNGFITVGTIGAATKYRYMRYTSVALGPEGTTARVICRSVKQNRTVATDTVTVSPLDLRVVGVLRNNTQTIFDDYGGNDTSLLEDEDVIRVDHMLPRRARFIGTGDQRAIISYTLPNTAAILIAPSNIGASAPANRDRNVSDTDANAYGASGSYIRIIATQLELHYNPGGVPAFKAFLFSTYTTLETLVDAINATVAGDTSKAWSCQLAPGIDGTMPTTSLTLTSQDIACTTAVSTTLASAALFGPVGVGMKVKGTNITAGTYVVSKASASSLTLSTAGTGAGAVTLTFYSDTGDEGFVTGGTVGYLRAFCPAFPVLLHMKPSAFPGYDIPDKASVYFTISSPGAASSGISLAPNSWVAGNKRLPHSSPRQLHARSCTGIVDIEGAAIIAYSDGIHMFANQRGANTGEDSDYRLFTVNDTRGCISYLGLTAGNGWAAYPTTEGIMATDKNRREFVISGDIYNPTDLTGDLAREIRLSAASVASDSDDQHFSMTVMGSKLAVAVRLASNFARVLFYDFSPGIEASGVEELLNPETKRAYIWSPPEIYNSFGTTKLLTIGAMGSIRNASGRVDYISYDDKISGLMDGRIDSITGLGDNGSTAFFTTAIPAPFVASPFMSLSPQTLEVTHRTSNVVGTLPVVAFANDQTPTFDTVTLKRDLVGDSLKLQFQKQVVPIDLGQRAKTDLFWTMWKTDHLSGTGYVDRLWRIVLQYNELKNS